MSEDAEHDGASEPLDPEDAKLVTRGRDAKFRPAQLDAAPLATASAWISDYERFWHDNLGALDTYLTQLQGEQS